MISLKTWTVYSWRLWFSWRCWRMGDGWRTVLFTCIRLVSYDSFYKYFKALPNEATGAELNSHHVYFLAAWTLQKHLKFCYQSKVLYPEVSQVPVLQFNKSDFIYFILSQSQTVWTVWLLVHTPILLVLTLHGTTQFPKSLSQLRRGSNVGQLVRHRFL
jgi:hypothetical protein